MKKVLILIAVLLLLILSLMLFYKYRYSMKVAEPIEVGDTTMAYHALIATQGSSFKDSLAADIIKQTKDRDFYIKVIDISSLRDIVYDDWTVVILLHTWEYGKPPEEIKVFMDRIPSSERLIVVATSGDGTSRMENVDAITSASKVSEIQRTTEEIVKRIETIISKPD